MRKAAWTDTHWWAVIPRCSSTKQSRMPGVVQILEIQEALGRAKDADDARAGGAADPRRWTGLRTIVDARAMLKAVFQAAAQSRVQVLQPAHGL